MPPVIEQLWTVFFFDPVLNALLILYTFLFNNFGLTIIVFTVIVRILILPLTLRQLRSAKSMSSLQPKIQEIQRKYGQDRERLSRETWALYKEHGVNPAGCALPLVVQMPIWIALYQSILFALGDRPENLLALADHLYPLALFDRLIPVSSTFLWLNLARPDPTYIIAVLVGVSAFIQQKMTTLPSTDSNQAQMNRMMIFMMPLMYGYFTVVVASGLAIYWLISNVIGIVIQYFVTGWGTLFPNYPGARGFGPILAAFRGDLLPPRGGPAVKKSQSSGRDRRAKAPPPAAETAPPSEDGAPEQRPEPRLEPRTPKRRSRKRK